MTRSITLGAALAICALGCQQENLQQEQNAEQRELAEEQRAEQRSLAEEQERERARAAEAARADLEDRTEEVREQQQEATAASQELTQAIALACNGIETPDNCPIANAHVTSSRNVDNGVAVTLSEECGTREQVEQRIECYRARTTLRGAPAAGQCIVDLTNENVTVAVTEDDNRVVVAMTHDDNDNDWVTRARNEVRQVIAVITPRRDDTARN